MKNKDYFFRERGKLSVELRDCFLNNSYGQSCVFPIINELTAQDLEQINCSLFCDIDRIVLMLVKKICKQESSSLSINEMSSLLVNLVKKEIGKDISHDFSKKIMSNYLKSVSISIVAEKKYSKLIRPWCFVLLKYDLAGIRCLIESRRDLKLYFFEYKTEVYELLNIVHGDNNILKNEEQFSHAVKNVLDYYFAEDYPLELCLNIARELIRSQWIYFDRHKCFNSLLVMPKKCIRLVVE